MLVLMENNSLLSIMMVALTFNKILLRGARGVKWVVLLIGIPAQVFSFFLIQLSFRREKLC